LEPDNVGLLSQLASSYQKTDKLAEAEKTYRKIISLQPENKDNYFNLGIIYKDMGKLAQARTEFIKASEKGGNWALPIYYEAYLYEQSASGCADFDRKVVYLLAYQTYKKHLQWMVLLIRHVKELVHLLVLYLQKRIISSAE